MLFHQNTASLFCYYFAPKHHSFPEHIYPVRRFPQKSDTGQIRKVLLNCYYAPHAFTAWTLPLTCFTIPLLVYLERSGCCAWFSPWSYLMWRIRFALPFRLFASDRDGKEPVWIRKIRRNPQTGGWAYSFPIWVSRLMTIYFLLPHRISSDSPEYKLEPWEYWNAFWWQ